MLHGLLAFQHVAQRFIASAKAGSYLAPFRKRVTFSAHVVEQDGVALLVPDDNHLLGAIFVPASLLAIAIGAGIGWLS